MLNLLVSAEFFESFDRYEPNENDYLQVVKKLLPDNWTFHRNGTWFNAVPPNRGEKTLPIQGWKIHISSSVLNAVEILNKIVPVCAADNTSFKFSLDERILSIMNGKRYPRQAAGKFITIYPYDEEHFKLLIENLYQHTQSFEGLYILSDKRYKDSKVVFYRYGGIFSIAETNSMGQKESKILSPKGEGVIDERVPYFKVPDWTRDPFESTSDKDSSKKEDISEITLKDERYLVKYALGHSNAGGVYVALDRQTSQEVVIKEARPFISAIENSVELLEKEFRLLKLLGNTGFVPKAIDFFRDWEHSFLVMERVPGVTLSQISVPLSSTIKVKPTLDETKIFYDSFQKIFLQVAKNLKILHSRNIVFTDFSPNNIIVDPDTLEIKILDFEAAYEIDVDKPVQLFTPGFMDPNQGMDQQANFDSDWFAFGAMMHHFLTHMNQVFGINPHIRYTYLKSVIKDIGFPEHIYNLIIGLLEKDTTLRPNYQMIIRDLEREVNFREPVFHIDKKLVKKESSSIIPSICSYILSKADYSRVDRLFPADGEIFNTNPLSLSFGAVGVAYCLKKMMGEPPQSVIDWILARNRSPELYPTGLYVGLSGIAWGLYELGLISESKEVLHSTFEHPLLFKSLNLHHGVSGWGMTNLKFFNELKDELYLQKAIEAGDFIIRNMSENAQGCFWDSNQSGQDIHLGYFYGGSGISLFLLYLYLASNKEIYLDVGSKFLDFDLNNSNTGPNGVRSWRRMVGHGKIVYPYLGEGSAGVGKTLVRYYRLLEEDKYLDSISDVLVDTNRKYTIFPGLISGLSGLGDFLLDAYAVTKGKKYLDGAYRVASGLLLSKIDREEGIAFPGNGLSRISCDYATGSAGIGCFFHRLANLGKSSDFLVDELFDKF